MTPVRLARACIGRRTSTATLYYHHHQQQSAPAILLDLLQEDLYTTSPAPAIFRRLFISWSQPHRHSTLPFSEAPSFHCHQSRAFAKAKKSKGDEETSSTPYEDVYPKIKENTVKQMEAALDALSRELSKLRTGRASAGLLDHVTVVDNNGIRSALTHVAAVTVIDNERLRVTPFDSSIVKCVERGIRASPLKLNPVADDDYVTVPLPKPTKEHLETMIKVVGKAGEAARVSIRRARQTAMDAIKASTGHVSKDDIKRREKEVDELTKKFVKTVDETCKTKEKEIEG